MAGGMASPRPIVAINNAGGIENRLSIESGNHASMASRLGGIRRADAQMK